METQLCPNKDPPCQVPRPSCESGNLTSIHLLVAKPVVGLNVPPGVALVVVDPRIVWEIEAKLNYKSNMWKKLSSSWRESWP